MNPLIDLGAVIFGSTGLVLAVAMLVREHREAPMWHRITVGVVGFLCLLVATNGSVAFRSFYFDFSPSPIAVGFAATLSINWAYRLMRRRR